MAGCDENVVLQEIGRLGADIHSIDAYGDMIAACFSDGSLRLYSWTRGKGFLQRDRVTKAHRYSALAVRFSTQGVILATGGLDGSACMWSVKDLQPIARLGIPGDAAVRTCRWSKDSTILVTAGDHCLCSWSIHTRSIMQTWQLPTDAIYGLTLCCSDRLVVAACVEGFMMAFYVNDYCQDIMNQDADTLKAAIRIDNAHDLGVLCLETKSKFINDDDLIIDETSRENRLASGGQDGIVRIWTIKLDLERNVTVEDLSRLEGHRSAVSCVRWAQGQKDMDLGSSSLDRSIRLWNTNKSVCLNVLRGHDRYVSTLVFSEHSEILATGSGDRSIRVWTIANTFTLESGLMTKETNDGIEDSLQSNCEEPVMLFTGHAGHAGAVNSLGWCKESNDRVLASACSDGVVRILRWSGAGLHVARDLTAHIYPSTSIHWNVTGTALLSASLDGTAVLWDVETGESLISVTMDGVGDAAVGGGGIREARLSPHTAGTMLLVAGDDNVAAIWRMSEAKCGPLQVLEGHNGAVTCCAWSPDGIFMVTGSEERDFRIWRAPRAERSHVPSRSRPVYFQEHAHDTGLLSCDWSKNNIIATGCADGVVKLWIIDTSYHEELDVSKIETVELFHILTGHSGSLWSARFNPDGSLLATAGGDAHARVWNAETGSCLWALATPSACSCALTASRFLALGCLDATVAIWSLPNQNDNND